MRWPSIWHIPLETGFDKARGECPVVSVQDQVDSGEGAKGLTLVTQDIGWDYSNPEGVEGGRGIKVVPGIGSQVVVIEGEPIGIPEEIEDTGAELRSGLTVACGLVGGTGLVKVVGQDFVRLVWERSCGIKMFSASCGGERYIHKSEFRSTGTVSLMLSVLSLES